MTPNQFKAALASLGLSQAQAAKWLGISLRACHGYANGTKIPKPIAMLLRHMTKLGYRPDQVR